MELLTTLRLRLRALWKRRQLDRDLADEMAHHLALRRQKLAEQGLDDAGARAASLRRFGNLALMQEETRALWTFAWLESLCADVRYAGRILRKSPVLSTVIVLSLALGIGANTAIFSVLDSVLFQMLPVTEPQRLVLLQWHSREWPSRVISDLEGNSRKDEKTGLSWSYSFSSSLYQYLRDNSRTFTDTLAFAANTQTGNVGLGAAARPAGVAAISGNFFQALGVAAIVGRTLAPSDDVPGALPVAVVSYKFWQRQMGGDPAAAGRVVTLNGQPLTIAGVAPREFFGVEPGSAPDLWIPLSHYTAEFKRVDQFDLADPKVWYLGIVGRLKPGATLEQARAEVQLLCDQKLQIGSPEVPRDNKVPAFDVTPADKGIDRLRYRFSTSLVLLMGMVGLVLLIACANVAGLLLAKATARRQEIAVRLSLGAPRSRVLRQLLTESVVLALAGGATGLLVARWVRQGLTALIENGRGAIVVPDQSNTTVLAFSAAVSVLCGIAFGLAPALRTTRTDILPVLKLAGGKATAGRGAFVSGKILVSAQVALSLLLLIGAGLMLRTLQRLHALDLGFDRDNLVTFRVHPGLNGYDPAQTSRYYEALQREIAAVPGVRSVAMSQLGPVGSGESSTSAVLPGYTEPGKRADMHRHIVGSGYFQTLGVPIVLGRGIGPQDTAAAPLVAVVNQKLARAYFRGDNPVGRQIQMGGPKQTRLITIVGVAADVKYNNIRSDPPPTFYLSYLQAPRVPTFMTIMARTAADPRAVIGGIRQAALKVDKEVPVVGLRTESETISQALFVERIFAVLTSSFGGLALLLACIGLYGTIGYTVAQRTNEIGIRIALGATPGRVLAMVLRETVLVVTAGVLIGLPLSWYATRLLKSQLFGLSPRDAATIAVSTAAILLVTLAAGFAPARRAARVDPMVALRCE